jgi:hypothetical protein
MVLSLVIADMPSIAPRPSAGEPARGIIKSNLNYC